MPYVGNKSTTFNTFSATDVSVTDDLTVTDDAAVGGNLTVTGSSILNGGLDVAGNLTIDTDGGNVLLKDGGTDFGQLASDSNSKFLLYSAISDGDMVFQGNDGGSTVTALTLDMSDAGTAIFNGAALARGAVVQRQYVNLTSTTQLGISGSLTEMSTSLRIAFTPKHASSVLYAELSAWFCSPNNNSLMYSRIFDVTNSAIASEPPSDGSRLRVHWSARKTKFDSNDFDYMHYIIPIAASDTNARTYTPYFGSEAGGGTVEFLSSTLSSTSGVNSPITFSITEIYNP